MSRDNFTPDFAMRQFSSYISGAAPTTRGGIKSVMMSYLSIFSSDKVMESLSGSNIDLELVRKSDAESGFTLYLIMPHSKLSSHDRLLRLWIGVFITVVSSRRQRPDIPTVFLLDECAQLGTLDELRTAVTLLRGYGLQVWMFFQDLSQLRDRYANDWENLINNCGTLQIFGGCRPNEAKTIGKLTGMKPEELMKLAMEHQVISTPGQEPRVARLFNYRKDPAFAGKFDDNPFFLARRRA